MPHSSSISPISRPSSTEPSTIRDSYYEQDQQQQQAHSNISQDPHVITFSTQSPTILPMTDYNNNQSIEFRDLNSGLAFAESHSTTTTNILNNKNTTTTNNHEDTTTHAVHAERCPRSPSIDSAIMPRFTKSSTMSTTDTNETSTSSQASRYQHYTSGLRIAHTEPSSKTHPESVGVAAGDFSKPRINKRSRRNTSSSSGSGGSARSSENKQQEFKYYGRHGNQWLFNDFSVTEAVSKGFRRVFSGSKEGGGAKDWYEDRDR